MNSIDPDVSSVPLCVIVEDDHIYTRDLVLWSASCSCSFMYVRKSLYYY